MTAPFWRTDVADMFDFGLTLVHSNGDSTLAILDEQDVLIADDVGHLHDRETVLTVKTGALTALAIGDVLTYDGTTSYTVRRFDVIDDGELTRIVVVT